MAFEVGSRVGLSKMTTCQRVFVSSVTFALAVSAWAPAQTQPFRDVPIPRASGQSVTPAFEGWYQNADGTFSLSFGYFNRNYDEHLDLPIGPDNRFEPGPADRGQPTHFFPRRQTGVFAVVVPANFGDNEVNWPLSFRGDTQTIPGTCIATGCSTHWEVGPAATRHRSSDSPRTARSTADRATHRRNH